MKLTKEELEMKKKMRKQYIETLENMKFELTEAGIKHELELTKTINEIFTCKKMYFEIFEVYYEEFIVHSIIYALCHAKSKKLIEFANILFNMEVITNNPIQEENAKLYKEALNEHINPNISNKVLKKSTNE